MNLQRLAVAAAVAVSAVPALADVGDPQIRTDHPWYQGELSCSTFERLFASEAEAYRRAVGVEPRSDEQKALASWYWRNTHFYHAEDGRQDIFGNGFANENNWTRDYWTGLFAFGFGLCGTSHSQWSAEMEKLLGHCRSRVVGVDGHSSHEVFLTGGPYGAGKWVLLDHDISTVIYDAGGGRLLSIPEIKADVRRLADQRYHPERQHGWLVSALHPDDAVGVYTSFNSAAYLAGYAGPPPMVHLRRGETLRRYLEPGLEDGKTFVYWGRNYSKIMPGPQRDRTWVNQPEKMYGAREGTPPHAGQARYGNAVYTYRPDFSNGDYREGIVSESDAHVVFEFHSPYLIGASPPTGELWGIYGPGCTNGLVLHGRTDCPVSISVDGGRTWRDCGNFRDGMDLTDHVKAQRQYLLRLDAGAEKLAGTGLTMVTVCQANAAILPHLKDGGTTVTYEASGKAVVSSGVTVEQAKSRVVAGRFGTSDVTLELATPRREAITAIHAAAQLSSSNPPQPEVQYRIDYSTDHGTTWKPIVKEWTILRRGDEPADFWSQSFCHGAIELPEKNVTSVQVRYHNTAGKNCMRAEIHCTYATRRADRTKVTFDWADDTGPHRESHVYEGGGAAWQIKTGRQVRTRWVEFEPVAFK